MISGFEAETKALTPREMNAANCLSNFFDNMPTGLPIRSVKLIGYLKANGYIVNGGRLRKIINYIRINGLVKGLLASHEGYYKAQSIKQVLDYTEGLKGRAKAINRVAEILEINI